MKTIRTILDRATRMGGTRFDRYYGSVAQSGAGYPTADEARKDLIAYRRSQHPGWPTR